MIPGDQGTATVIPAVTEGEGDMTIGELADRDSLVPRARSRHRTVWLLMITAVVAAALGSAATAYVMRPEPAGEWKSVFREDFNTDAPVGDFPGQAYGSRFTTYPDGWEDTSGRGEYRPSEVLSVGGGSLNWDMWVENRTTMGAAVLPTLPTYGQIYGQYSVRFRADPTPGFGMAFLLWPDSEKWPRDGEIDFPEGEFSGTIFANAHHASDGGEVDAFSTDAGFDGWHVATIAWRPSDVTFLLDGVVVGVSTTAVPTRSMHWVLQTGSAGTAPASSSSTARVQVDWIEAFARQ